MGVRTYTSGTISPAVSETVTVPFYAPDGALVVRVVLQARGDSEITATGNPLVERVGSRTSGFGAPTFSGAGTAVIGTAFLGDVELRGSINEPLMVCHGGDAIVFTLVNASTAATKFQVYITLWEP